MSYFEYIRVSTFWWGKGEAEKKKNVKPGRGLQGQPSFSSVPESQKRSTPKNTHPNTYKETLYTVSSQYCKQTYICSEGKAKNVTKLWVFSGKLTIGFFFSFTLVSEFAKFSIINKSLYYIVLQNNNMSFFISTAVFVNHTSIKGGGF